MLDFSVTFFFTIVNITFLYLVLKRILFKPVSKFIEDRSDGIQNDIDTAKRMTARADALLAEYEEKLEKAHEKGQSILLSAHERAEKDSSVIIAKAREEADRIIRATRKSLEDERVYAEHVLMEQTADLSIQAASRILQTNIDSGKNRALVAEFLESVGAS